MVNSKLFLIVLYLYLKLRLPFFLSLNNRVSNHVFFNTLYQLRLKLFLKYILNSDYREYISLLAGNLHECLGKNAVQNVISEMLFSTKKRFVTLLVNSIQNIRIDHGDFIRQSTVKDSLSPKFAWDYMLYIDFALQFLISRVKDLSNSEKNNYRVYVDYLFILNDWLLILMEELPGISRARLKGTILKKERGNG